MTSCCGLLQVISLGRHGLHVSHNWMGQERLCTIAEPLSRRGGSLESHGEECTVRQLAARSVVLA